MPEAVRTGRKWVLAIALLSALSGVVGCAGLSGGSPPGSLTGSPAPSYSPIGGKPRTFSPPTAMDSLLGAHPLPLSGVVPASAPDSGKTASAPQPVDKNVPAGTFQIQVDALAGMDAAQSRKAELENKLGVKMEMIFDPPYYKLRFGNFSSRAEAEDKLLELAQKNVQGFIVRQ